MSVLDSIVRDLEKLPPSRLIEVADFVGRLDPERMKKRITLIQATAGCMAGEEGEDFERAVREEADRVDLDEWK